MDLYVKSFSQALDSTHIPDSMQTKSAFRQWPYANVGYKRHNYFAKIGRISADEKTIDMLEIAIEQQALYISDYF